MCPACLLRLALAPGLSATIDHEPAARLVGPVGRGPHGVVHLAARPDDDPQLVTVKVIEAATDPQRFCERMRQTGIALDSLRHPGIPEVVQIGVRLEEELRIAHGGPSINSVRQVRQIRGGSARRAG